MFQIALILHRRTFSPPGAETASTSGVLCGARCARGSHAVLALCTLAAIAPGPLHAQAPRPPQTPQPPISLPAPISLQANVLGQPLTGLTDDQTANFEAGVGIFTKVTPEASGLGPVFNGTACAECHKSGAIGGAGMDLTIARVTRFGGLLNGVYSDMKELGGPVLQSRSLHEFDLTYPGGPEVVPPQALYVSHRITTAIFGDGLIEAVPEATILAATTRPDPDGVHGTANYIFNPEDNRTELGRFGWKAQMPTLHLFGGDAYLNEMGVTTTTFPTKNLPQGRPIPPGFGIAESLQDEDKDVTSFTSFMQLLAPPSPRLPFTPDMQNGQSIFNAIRCSACHTPTLTTGNNVIAAMANQTIHPYSDFLVHHMGPYLADGVQQGLAAGDQFKTAPLWGLSHRSFYLHDGRATTLMDAVLAHGGEATAARTRFQGLRVDQRNQLLAFLGGL